MRAGVTNFVNLPLFNLVFRSISQAHLVWTLTTLLIASGENHRKVSWCNPQEGLPLLHCLVVNFGERGVSSDFITIIY